MQWMKSISQKKIVILQLWKLSSKPFCMNISRKIREIDTIFKNIWNRFHRKICEINFVCRKICQNGGLDSEFIVWFWIDFTEKTCTMWSLQFDSRKYCAVNFCRIFINFWPNHHVLGVRSDLSFDKIAVPTYLAMQWDFTLTLTTMSAFEESWLPQYQLPSASKGCQWHI